jgi:NAD+ kinase
VNGKAPGPTEVKTAALLSHTQPEQTDEAVRLAVELAGDAGCEIVASAEERAKHGDPAEIGALEELDGKPDVCVVLGGDGTILKALRWFADTDVPVFGINYGTVGFLAAVDPEDVRDGLTRAFSVEFEVMSLPALDAGEGRLALNDVSFHRRPHGRVAELTFSLGGQDVGHVRCDGLVAATPAGSTGYNLANNGPILAWGARSS